MTSRSTSSRAPSSRPIPSARESSPLLGRLSSPPPGSRTSGSWSGSIPSSSAAGRSRRPPGRASCTADAAAWRTRGSGASPSSDRGPIISIPMFSPLWSASRRLMKVVSSSSRERRRPRTAADADVAIDGDVAHRLVATAVRNTVCPERRFISPRNPDGAVTDDLVAGGILDRGLSLEDRHQRVGGVADLEQDLAGLGRSFLADLGERLELSLGEDGAHRFGHRGKSIRRPGAPRRPDRDVATVETNATEEAQMDPATVISIIAILIVAAIALRVFGSD